MARVCLKGGTRVVRLTCAVAVHRLEIDRSTRCPVSGFAIRFRCHHHAVKPGDGRVRRHSLYHSKRHVPLRLLGNLLLPMYGDVRGPFCYGRFHGRVDTDSIGGPAMAGNGWCGHMLNVDAAYRFSSHVFMWSVLAGDD